MFKFENININIYIYIKYHLNDITKLSIAKLASHVLLGVIPYIVILRSETLCSSIFITGL